MREIERRERERVCVCEWVSECAGAHKGETARNASICQSSINLSVYRSIHLHTPVGGMQSRSISRGCIMYVTTYLAIHALRTQADARLIVRSVRIYRYLSVLHHKYLSIYLCTCNRRSRNISCRCLQALTTTWLVNGTLFGSV